MAECIRADALPELRCDGSQCDASMAARKVLKSQKRESDCRGQGREGLGNGSARLRVSAHEQMKFNPARSSIRDGMAE